MMRNKGFKTLNVWKKADELAYAVYQATKAFSKHELFGVVWLDKISGR